jgi:PIN domain nuclease of toxin-antitoxin system
MKFVLDTHTAVWLTLSPDRLGETARLAVTGVKSTDLVISDVTLSEVARLIRSPKKGVSVDSRRGEWMESFASCFNVQAVTARIADQAADYGFEHRDPCDRHILATAQIIGLPLITVDTTLTKCAKASGVRVIW